METGQLIPLAPALVAMTYFPLGASSLVTKVSFGFTTSV